MELSQGEFWRSMELSTCINNEELISDLRTNLSSILCSKTAEDIENLLQDLWPCMVMDMNLCYAVYGLMGYKRKQIFNET